MKQMSNKYHLKWFRSTDIIIFIICLEQDIFTAELPRYSRRYSRPLLNTIKRTLNAIKSITCNSAPKLQTYFYILSNLWGVGSGCQFVTTLIT